MQKLHQWKLHGSCDFRHRPECQHYQTESGCKFGEQCVFIHREVGSQPNKKPKKTGGGKGSVALLKSSQQWGSVLSRRNPIRFYGKPKNLGTKAQRVILKCCTTPQKIEKERVHRKVWFGTLVLRSVVFMHRNLRKDLKKKPWHKNDAPAELRGELPKVSCNLKEKDKQLHSTRRRRFGVHQHHPQRNQRKQN